MDALHKLLLLVIAGIIVWLTVSVVRLLHRGMIAAQTGLRWRDIDPARNVMAPEGRTALSRTSVVASVVKRIVQIAWIRKTSPRKPSLALAEQILADPIDGTIFQHGEAIVRCACGAAYHAHTWQWLAANNGGKCVSCKQAS